MEFKNEALIEREKEIAGFLLEGLSLNKVSQKTGLSKKHLNAHISNMMKKLKADDTVELIKILKTKNFLKG